MGALVNLMVGALPPMNHLGVIDLPVRAELVTDPEEAVLGISRVCV